ncbi:phosphoribosylglycinamide formyltransferase [Leucothrix arctica]|uniref:phosphoribosylglycinamide formyltransferase n=1 Tax=Leucothrix arctica TaxID=1481894 RepID=UPI001479694A|nr:phosphoribosylglycinamide formyltransferase [Leucothrix arctica]
MRSIVVLISGSGSNLQAIMDRLAADNLDAKIELVLSNRADAFGLERAAKAGIPTAVIDHKQFDSREAFDQEMIKVIDPINPELIVLAGFMRILSEGFVEHYNGRMINIHPALLPAYKGLDTHKRALADGVSHHGASVHYVTPELDSGAVIVQGRVPVLAGDDEEALQARVHKIEHVVYPEVVTWFANGRLNNQGDIAYLDGKPLTQPVIIDQETVRT